MSIEISGSHLTGGFSGRYVELPFEIILANDSPWEMSSIVQIGKPLEIDRSLFLLNGIPSNWVSSFVNADNGQFYAFFD